MRPALVTRAATGGVAAGVIAMVIGACGAVVQIIPTPSPSSSEARDHAIARAQVWMPTAIEAVSMVDWTAEPIWAADHRCVGNLARSLTGTLENPVIGDAGRRFLAGLLMRLSDRQIHQLFETARVHLRLRDPDDVQSGYGTIAEGVSAFKEKRRQIVQRRC